METVPQYKTPLPNASGVLVMGILSIVLGCGIGLILGIIGLTMSKEPKRLYTENPDKWSGYGSYNAGRIMSIIGVCINGLVIAYFIFVFAIAGTIVGIANGGFWNNW